jgi:hypothetical protein
VYDHDNFPGQRNIQQPDSIEKRWGRRWELSIYALMEMEMDETTVRTEQTKREKPLVLLSLAMTHGIGQRLWNNVDGKFVTNSNYYRLKT